jgi:cytochrome c556
MKKLGKLLIAGIAAAALSTAALADAVTERQAVMKDTVKNFKPLVGMVKGEVPFDAATVQKNAAAIAANLEKARKLFPEGSEKGEKESRAKPEIWLLEDEFQDIFKTAVKRAKALANIKSKEEFVPAVMALGKDGCGTCHKKFRLPKK